MIHVLAYHNLFAAVQHELHCFEHCTKITECFSLQLWLALWGLLCTSILMEQCKRNFIPLGSPMLLGTPISCFRRLTEAKIPVRNAEFSFLIFLSPFFKFRTWKISLQNWKYHNQFSSRGISQNCCPEFQSCKDTSSDKHTPLLMVGLLAFQGFS